MLGVYVGAVALALCWYIYYKNPWIVQDLRYLALAIRSVVWVKQCSRSKSWIIDQFEKFAEKTPTKTFLIFEKKKYDYSFMNEQANKVANFALSQGWKCGDVVALCVYNEPAFLWTFLGLQKCGIISALINTNLRAKSLQHCLQVCDAKAIIVGQSKELQSAVKEVATNLGPGVDIFAQGEHNDFPEGWHAFDEPVSSASHEQPDKSIRGSLTQRSCICYIYTSGTTGLPKPAYISMDRTLRGAVLSWISGLGPDDVMYTTLPLYHSAAALAALGGVIMGGATLVLRPKFSASQFWNDCREHNVTVIQYIGELCRFLVNRPKTDLDKQHSVRLAYGNGLRADIWPEFQDRFGIQDVVDFYAATEGNMGFINLFNKQGSVGRFAPLMKLVTPIKFLKYDFDTAQPVRDKTTGRCIEVEVGEPGLMVCQIRRDLEFDGYAGKKELTNSKILHNVAKEGDTYFNSGDLLMMDKEHFVYFSDRIGDTYRWKGENVSTTEVSNVLCDMDWIEDASVYGVTIPGADGKCGMVALTLKGRDFVTSDDLVAIYRHCDQYLTSYARPRFLRVQKEMVMTATFKQQKFTLVKEGFDPALMTHDAVYYLDSDKQTYSPVDGEVFDAINKGKIRM